MSVREDRENRPKVHLPGLRSGLFPECKLRLSETYLFRNPDLSIPGFRLALAIASLAGMTTRLFFGNPTHRPDLRPGFAKDDLTENALNLSARGKRPLTPLARASNATGKNLCRHYRACAITSTTAGFPSRTISMVLSSAEPS